MVMEFGEDTCGSVLGIVADHHLHTMSCKKSLKGYQTRFKVNE